MNHRLHTTKGTRGPCFLLLTISHKKKASFFLGTSSARGSTETQYCLKLWASPGVPRPSGNAAQGQAARSTQSEYRAAIPWQLSQPQLSQARQGNGQQSPALPPMGRGPASMPANRSPSVLIGPADLLTGPRSCQLHLFARELDHGVRAPSPAMTFPCLSCLSSEPTCYPRFPCSDPGPLFSFLPSG